MAEKHGTPKKLLNACFQLPEGSTYLSKNILKVNKFCQQP